MSVVIYWLAKRPTQDTIVTTRMTLQFLDQDDIAPPKCSFFGTFKHFELSPPTSLQIYAQALEPPVFQSRGLMSSGYENVRKNADNFERK